MCERRCGTPIHLNPVLRQTNGTGRFTQGNGAELMGDERPLVPESGFAVRVRKVHLANALGSKKARGAHRANALCDSSPA